MTGLTNVAWAKLEIGNGCRTNPDGWHRHFQSRQCRRRLLIQTVYRSISYRALSKCIPGLSTNVSNRTVKGSMSNRTVNGRVSSRTIRWSVINRIIKRKCCKPGLSTEMLYTRIVYGSVCRPDFLQKWCEPDCLRNLLQTGLSLSTDVPYRRVYGSLNPDNLRTNQTTEVKNRTVYGLFKPEYLRTF